MAFCYIFVVTKETKYESQEDVHFQKAEISKNLKHINDLLSITKNVNFEKAKMNFAIYIYLKISNYPNKIKASY